MWVSVFHFKHYQMRHLLLQILYTAHTAYVQNENDMTLNDMLYSIYINKEVATSFDFCYLIELLGVELS